MSENMEGAQGQGTPAVAGKTDDGRVYVVTQNGMAVEGPPDPEEAEEGEVEEAPEQSDGAVEESRRSVTEMVEQPAKVMRIGNMIRQLLDEVKAAPLDEASRMRLRDIHSKSIAELREGLSPELVDELERITLPFSEDAAPSDAELRIAQAQLVGWLEGLFHGIQTALFAQQMAARSQLEQMRQALPPGVAPGPGGPAEGDGGRNGMYL